MTPRLAVALLAGLLASSPASSLAGLLDELVEELELELGGRGAEGSPQVTIGGVDNMAVLEANKEQIEELTASLTSLTSSQLYMKNRLNDLERRIESNHPAIPAIPAVPAIPDIPAVPAIPDAGPNGVLLLGGYGTLSVEVWSPNGTSCNLPSLPRIIDNGSGDIVQPGNRIIACRLDTCEQLGETGWEKGPSTFKKRYGHTSFVTPDGLWLVGGWGPSSSSSVELIPSNGDDSKEMFNNIRPGRIQHCSIKMNDSSLIITGGRSGGSAQSALSLVTQLSILRDSKHVAIEVIATELPGLINQRYGHACGVYEVGNIKRLIVAGGFNPENSGRTSTEVMDFPTGQWTESTPLPSARRHLTGATLSGIFYVFGGMRNSGRYVDEILSWDGTKWEKVGQMLARGGNRAVAILHTAHCN